MIIVTGSALTSAANCAGNADEAVAHCRRSRAEPPQMQIYIAQDASPAGLSAI